MENVALCSLQRGVFVCPAKKNWSDTKRDKHNVRSERKSRKSWMKLVI